MFYYITYLRDICLGQGKLKLAEIVVMSLERNRILHSLAFKILKKSSTYTIMSKSFLMKTRIRVTTFQNESIQS